MDIKPRHLIYLAAIGQHHSFVRAAEFLNVSQPALSLSVQRMEDITKVRLVDRGRNGALLTHAGKLLARRGREIDVAISSAAEEIELLSHGISGRLRVGGTPLSTHSIIPAVISRILNVTDDVAIDIVEGLDENLLEMLGRNELDLVVGAPGTAASRPIFETAQLFSAKTVLVVRPGHPLLSQDQVSLADLENALWAMPPKGGAFRNQIEALFTVNSISFPQRTFQASSVHILKRIVEISNAMTLAAEQVVLDELKLGRLSSVEVKEPIALRVFCLHTRRKRELGDLGKLFCSLASELSASFSVQSPEAP